MSSGGGNTQVTTENPYAPSEPYLKDIMSEAENIYQSDAGKSYFPGSTVVPFAPDTAAALDLQRARSYDLMGPSSIYNTAVGTATDAATGAMGTSYGGPNLGIGIGSSFMNRQSGGLDSAYTGRQAYGELTPQADYLSSVRSAISSDVMGDIQSQFAGQGRTGTSPAAQAAASRAFTQAYAPIAQSAAEAERTRELSAREADIVRQQQARTGAIGREFRADQSQIGREQQALEAQQRRLYGASQADIGRRQQANEAMLRRRLSGANMLPGLQGGMDDRINMGISGLGGVGAAYEDLAGRQIQDQIARFDYEQQSPFMRLQQYASLINPIAGRGTSQYASGPSANPLLSGLTGAYMGSQMFGGNPYGMAIGALGGILG